ncbi:MAG: response regulator transcription factor [Sulfurovum sp.]
MIRILLLEDDKLFNETIEDFLSEEDFVIDCVLDPYTALDYSYKNNYHLYLFDVNLPYENGFELLGKLRESGDETPCIFITSRDDIESLKSGFGVGGDDYITKPIELEELLLRIKALLRRQVRVELIDIDGYKFNTIEKRLSKDGKNLELSIKAGELLLTLLESKGNIVSSEQIKDSLWSSEQEASDGSLRVYITQLKKYFPTQITNIRGVGYMMSL